MINKEELNRRRYSKEWIASKSDLIRVNKIVNWVGSNKKVLDIACYDGTISKLVKDNNNVVYGLDISKKAVEISNGKGIIAIVFDVEKKLPFLANTFDVVIAGEIIEHVYDTDYFLREIHRVLRSDGELILTTPNLATLGRRILLFLGKNPLIEVSINGGGGHIRYFVKDNLFQLLEDNGFKVVEFTSDIINFNRDGRIFSIGLARIFPTLGRTLIVRCIS